MLVTHKVIGSAPRRWGYTFSKFFLIPAPVVCPTQVGIHRLRSGRRARIRGLPHAGGDTPGECRGSTYLDMSAPRRWGYTPSRRYERRVYCVCPTQVGIHRSASRSTITTASLPHAGGDTPVPKKTRFAGMLSAPRRWGYTSMSQCPKYALAVCPTQVGIHPRIGRTQKNPASLPHAGGDTPFMDLC